MKIERFDEYDAVVQETARYEGKGKNLVYEVMGLAGEVGELANKVKKILRGDSTLEEMRAALIAELGDVLWYVGAVAFELGISLGKVAWLNAEKLRDRIRRGVIKGNGDDR